MIFTMCTAALTALTVGTWIILKNSFSMTDMTEVVLNRTPGEGKGVSNNFGMAEVGGAVGWERQHLRHLKPLTGTCRGVCGGSEPTPADDCFCDAECIEYGSWGLRAMLTHFLHVFLSSHTTHTHPTPHTSHLASHTSNPDD